MLVRNRLTTAVASLATAGVLLLGAPGMATAATAGTSAALPGEVSFVVDPVKIATTIDRAVDKEENREAFVRNVTNEAWYNLGEQKYNVMVYNLEKDYDEDLTGVVGYTSAKFDGTTYGVWIFEAGHFQAFGDRGLENWSFRGVFDRPEDNKNSLTFHDF